MPFFLTLTVTGVSERYVIVLKIEVEPVVPSGKAATKKIVTFSRDANGDLKSATTIEE